MPATPVTVQPREVNVSRRKMRSAPWSSTIATRRPGGALAATLLFGFGSALAQRLPAFSPAGAVLFQALPYVLTLIAVTGLVGRSIPPLALGRPLKK